MKKVIPLFALLVIIFQVKAQSGYSDFKKVDSNLHLLWFHNYGVKTILAEFDKYLVVVEFPKNDTVVNSIINTAKIHFPDKPIKYVLHTHHHSHSAIGFDTFLELTDAQLVTSLYNYKKIKTITEDTLKLVNRCIINDSLFILKSASNELICFMVKKEQYSVPTKEFNIIYFPKQKAVVSGCLYQKPLGYHQVVNDRKLALKRIIVDKTIDVDYFIPTNTCRKTGFEDICTMEMLDSTLLVGIKPEQVADNFQSKSLEYLESNLDSLIKEFEKIPSYYDYYQCGKTLLKRKEYSRALIIFNLIPEVYSEFSHNVYLYSGDCYKLLGNKEKAKIFYLKYIDCAISDSEITYGRNRIDELK